MGEETVTGLLAFAPTPSPIPSRHHSAPSSIASILVSIQAGPYEAALVMSGVSSASQAPAGYGINSAASKPQSGCYPQFRWGK
jgi:hypothetical protein